MQGRLLWYRCHTSPWLINHCVGYENINSEQKINLCATTNYSSKSIRKAPLCYYVSGQDEELLFLHFAFPTKENRGIFFSSCFLMWILPNAGHFWNKVIWKAWLLSCEYGLESAKFLRYVKDRTEKWKLPMRVSQRGKSCGKVELTGSSCNNTLRPLGLAARERLPGYRAENELNTSPPLNIFITVNMKAFHTRRSHINEPWLN